MRTFTFDDDEHAALVRLLKESIDGDRYQLSPRVRGWKAILAKLEPPRSAPAALAPLKPRGEPSMVLAKKRARRR